MPAVESFLLRHALHTLHFISSTLSSHKMSLARVSTDSNKTPPSCTRGYFVFWGRASDAVYAKPPVTYYSGEPASISKITKNDAQVYPDSILPVAAFAREEPAATRRHEEDTATLASKQDEDEDEDDTVPKAYPCDYPGCSQICARAFNLARHMRAVHNVGRSECGVCGARLARLDAVARHQAISTRCIRKQQELIVAGAAQPQPRSADDILASLRCILLRDPRRATFIASDVKSKDRARTNGLEHREAEL